MCFFFFSVTNRSRCSYIINHARAVRLWEEGESVVHVHSVCLLHEVLGRGHEMYAKNEAFTLFFLKANSHF